MSNNTNSKERKEVVYQMTDTPTDICHTMMYPFWWVHINMTKQITSSRCSSFVLATIDKVFRYGDTIKYIIQLSKIWCDRKSCLESKTFKAACLQIHANFHECFENLSKNTVREPQKIFFSNCKTALSTHVNNLKEVNYAKFALTVLLMQ
jgi:hypothetical protein